MNARIVALLVAAGQGVRAGGDTPKQFAKLGGKAVVSHAAAALSHPMINDIRIVISDGQQDMLTDALGAAGDPIIGGATRRQSVRHGLEAIASQGGADIVLIHDAARPFLPASVIDALIAALDDADGAVPVLPVADTLSRAGDRLGDTVARDGLVRVQTPQAFRFDEILAAHREWGDATDATDDATIARAAGLSIATVPGSPDLDKLTYAGDFARAAQRFAQSGRTPRTGLGYDVHAFAPGDHVWLGGIKVPHERSLAGHSDADVLLHAITDALLGAIGAGDIGDHFPPSDPKWKGAASDQFLIHACNLVREAGGHIAHVDAVIICEAPRIGPHKDAIRANIARLLGLAPHRVSVKATTSERLGFTGRKEGMAAQAIATIMLPEFE